MNHFPRDTASWLTFFTTTTLGLLTAYFAFRTRQLERAQLRQINRQADQELAEAEREINDGILVMFYWNQWRATNAYDLYSTFLLYFDIRQNLRLPDLPKVVRILSFYLPAAESEASEGIIKLTATRTYLEQLQPLLSRARTNEGASQIMRAEDGLLEADNHLKRAIELIKCERRRLRTI